VYFSGKTYYLVPDGPVGQKPYSLIRQVMEDEGLVAVAQIVMSGREKLVLVRPVGTLLAMSDLNYDSEVKKASAFEDEVEAVEFQDAELELTKKLVEAFVKEDFDLAAYKDETTEKLAQLIEAKVEGKEIVAAAKADEPQVINLMEALRKSVAEAQGAAPKGKAMTAKKKAAPKRKMAKSATKTAAKKKARKSDLYLLKDARSTR
jgi:DNA end-binding protein Ku